MVGEITAAVGYEGAISAEADTEMEHEESNENEKEKTTSAIQSLLPIDNSIISKRSLSTYKDPYWKSPSIDFHTPPPKLA